MQRNWSLVKVGMSILAHYNHTHLLYQGILGEVLIDDVRHQSWKAYSMEFKHSFIARYVVLLLFIRCCHSNNSIEGGGLWKRTPPPGDPGPALYKTSFNIKSEPQDTFADITVI